MDLRQQQVRAKWKGKRERGGLLVVAAMCTAIALMVVSLALGEYVMNRNFLWGYAIIAVVLLVLAIVLGLRAGRIPKPTD